MDEPTTALDVTTEALIVKLGPQRPGAGRGDNRYRRKGRLTARVSCWFDGMMPAAAAPMSRKRFDPLLGMHYTVNHSGAEPTSPAEALRAYTSGTSRFR